MQPDSGRDTRVRRLAVFLLRACTRTQSETRESRIASIVPRAVSCVPTTVVVRADRRGACAWQALRRVAGRAGDPEKRAAMRNSLPDAGVNW